MLWRDEKHRYMLEVGVESTTCPACGTSFERKDARPGTEVDSDLACPNCWQGFIEPWCVEFEKGFARCPCGATTSSYKLPVNICCGFCGARFLLGVLPVWSIDRSGEVVRIGKPDEQPVAEGAYLPGGIRGGESWRDVKCRSCGRTVYSEDQKFRPHPKALVMAFRGRFRDVSEVDGEDCPYCQERSARVNKEQKAISKEISDAVHGITELAHRAGVAMDIAVETNDPSRSLDGIKDAMTMIATVYKKLKAIADHEDPRMKQFAADAQVPVQQAFVKAKALIRELSGG